MTNIQHLRLLSAMLLLSTVISAQEVSITDFRIPESRYRTLMFTLNGGLGNNWSGGNPNFMYSNASKNIYFMVDHSIGLSSEEVNYSFGTTMSGGTSANNDRNERPVSSPKLLTSDNSNENIEITYNGSYSRYITPDELYWFAASGGNGTYSLSHSSNAEDGVDQYRNFNKNQNYAMNLSGGIGYGRTRDARSVVVILRIMEKLMEDGYLTRTLSNDEVIALAERYEAALTNNIEHSRPKKYIVKIIFEDLLEKGLITTDKVIAYATERTVEVFQEGIYPRVFGWSVQAGPNIYRTEQIYRSQSPFGWTSKEGGNDLVLHGSYGYPFSTQLHWSSNATILLPIYGRQNRVDYSLTSKFIYEVSERISSIISANLSRSNYYVDGSAYSQGMFRFTNYFNLFSELHYFIEDQISFSIRGSYSDQVQRTEPTWGSSKQIDDYYSLTFGVNYRIF
jgi:hypothetical protein